MPMPKRLLLPALLPLFLLFLGPAPAQAQDGRSAIGPHVGYNLDAPRDNLFIGTMAHLNVESIPLILNPAIDFYLGDGTFAELDANALFPFGVDNATFTPYAGGGLALGYYTFEDEAEVIDESNTSIGFNAVAGVFADVASLRPFGEARVTIGDVNGGTSISLRGGLLFGF